MFQIYPENWRYTIKKQFSYPCVFRFRLPSTEASRDHERKSIGNQTEDRLILKGRLVERITSNY